MSSKFKAGDRLRVKETYFGRAGEFPYMVKGNIVTVSKTLGTHSFQMGVYLTDSDGWWENTWFELAESKPTKKPEDLSYEV